MALFALAIVSAGLPWFFERMSVADWALLEFGSLFGTLAHLLLIEAYRRAPTSVVSPMIYTQIVAASLLGLIVFDEWPTPATLLGALIVAASGIALIRTRL